MKKSTAKGKGVSKTSTPVARKMKTTKSCKSSKSQQVNKRSGETSLSYTRQYKMSEKQTKSWKPLDKELKEHLCKEIDSCVRMVGSKPIYIKDDDVQDLLSRLKMRLKLSLDKISVPKKKYKNFKELRHTAAELRMNYDNLTNQQLELEKEIRQEERMIEALEEGCEIEELNLEVPENVLGLPRMVFSRS